jgi:Na+-translocating ferredoxin:NAD+ oxidoreductase RnfG subunit
LVHLARCLLLVTIVLVIHWQHRRARVLASSREAIPSVEAVQKIFPNAATVAEAATDTWQVSNADGAVLGSVIQTSPAASDVIGFSGPTNMLLGFSEAGTLVGMTIVSSEDTRDHVQSIRSDSRFLTAWNGLSREEILAAEVDATSGATLTCVAIRQSIARRLGSVVVPGKFPEPLTLDDVQLVFPEAGGFADVLVGGTVNGASGKELGTILRTSPVADNEMGYQGPTDTLIGFSPNGTIVGLAVRKSYDNEPYVGYVRDDWGFPGRFKGLNLKQLAELNLEEAGIEGVAGATMTSMGVARSMILTAQDQLNPPPLLPSSPSLVTVRDYGTMSVVAFGALLALTRLRGSRLVRLAFQLVLIGYLGLINGDMLSQALLVGWARSGVPWATASGVVVLSVAAFAIPISTGRNVYCSHLCPHGAVQQLVRNRLPWRVKLSRRWTRLLTFLPGLLLLWVVVVGTTGLAFSLVDIEPFDAWLLSVAGTATIAVAGIGLVASLFVPMAYCRFGCPTGALLQFVRKNRRSSEITGRDHFAIVCLMVAIALFVIN